MKLNLYILKEDLKQWNFTGSPGASLSAVTCSYPVLCTETPAVFDRDAVYVMAAGLLPEWKTDFSQISVICIGTPAEDWLRASCDLIYTEEIVSETEVLNKVSQCFYRYQTWGDSLQQVIDENLPLEELALRSGGMINNPIYAQLDHYRNLFHYIPELDPPSLLYKTYTSYSQGAGYVLNNEEVMDLIADPEFNRTDEATEPSVWYMRTFDFRFLYYNIRIRGNLVARLYFAEILEPFSEKDYGLIKILGSYLKKALLKEKIRPFGHIKKLDHVLEALLQGGQVPDSQLLEVLEQLEWEMDDRYLCVLLDSRSDSVNGGTLELFALNLFQACPQSCYTVYNDRIVLVCNLTCIKKTPEQLISTLVPVLRDNLLTAGFSEVYRNFKMLPDYFRQASAACEIGMKKNPTHWYFRYGNYQLDDLIGRYMAGTAAETRFPSGLKELMRYDVEKGTNYTELLKIYLRLERNIAETARVMFIHRSTFMYQLRKIETILRMNLDQPEVRFILQAAFYVMEAEGEGDCREWIGRI